MWKKFKTRVREIASDQDQLAAFTQGLAVGSAMIAVIHFSKMHGKVLHDPTHIWLPWHFAVGVAEGATGLINDTADQGLPQFILKAAPIEEVLA